jgi:hypothetical protein
MRRRVRPGPLAVALGLLTAALTGAVAALLALASGWVAPVTAAIGGLSVAVLVAVVALVSMARSPTPEAHGDGPGASRPEGSPDVLLTGR